jgi:hypothetical protein
MKIPDQRHSTRRPQYGHGAEMFSPSIGFSLPMMNAIARRAWRTLSGYAAAEDGSSASEFALMLLILGGCVVTAVHALGAR